jgi:hypothetical protein
MSLDYNTALTGTYFDGGHYFIYGSEAVAISNPIVFSQTRYDMSMPTGAFADD